jgi:hypothetical protein
LGFPGEENPLLHHENNTFKHATSVRSRWIKHEKQKKTQKQEKKKVFFVSFVKENVERKFVFLELKRKWEKVKKHKMKNTDKHRSIDTKYHQENS